MKKLPFLRRLGPIVMGCLTMALLVCCTHEDTEPAAGTASDKSDIDVIRSMGYDVSDLVAYDDYYLVEGDICITQEKIQEARQSPTTRHSTNVPKDDLLDANSQINIKVGIVGMGSKYQDVITRAIHTWNDVPGCNLYFKLDFSSPDITISAEEFYQNDWGPDYDVTTLMKVLPPSGKKPGNSIKINTKFAGLPTDLYSSSLVGMFMHALGHTVGFGHTGEDSHISYTPKYDQGSIMGKTYHTSFPGSPAFTLDDLAALRILYPTSVSFKWTPNDKELVAGKEYTLKAEQTKPGIPAFTFTINNSGKFIEFSKFDPQTIKMTFPRAGQYEIKALMTDARGNTFLPQRLETFMVNVVEDGGTTPPPTPPQDTVPPAPVVPKLDLKGDISVFVVPDANGSDHILVDPKPSDQNLNIDIIAAGSVYKSFTNTTLFGTKFLTLENLPKGTVFSVRIRSNLDVIAGQDYTSPDYLYNREKEINLGQETIIVSRHLGQPATVNFKGEIGIMSGFLFIPKKNLIIDVMKSASETLVRNIGPSLSSGQAITTQLPLGTTYFLKIQCREGGRVTYYGNTEPVVYNGGRDIDLGRIILTPVSLRPDR